MGCKQLKNIILIIIFTFYKSQIHLITTKNIQQSAYQKCNWHAHDIKQRERNERFFGIQNMVITREHINPESEERHL